MSHEGLPRKPVLIAGPTASGKSALALSLAERLGGVIVNADSMQVYRDLRIITARPSPADEGTAPHRLYGHVDAGENHSVGRWLADAAAALQEAAEQGRPVIVVGGTGLYFTALTQGLAAVPPVPLEVRAAVRDRLARDGIAPLFDELRQRDPASAARLMPRDRSRIARALEVFLATGRPLSDWHREGLPPVLTPAQTLGFVLTIDRHELHRRIDGRFDAMLASGALEEVRHLAARGLDPALPAMKAHGVPWLIRHLRSDISLEEAAEGGKRDTRRYTKRQETWFRNQFPGWGRVAAPDAERSILDALAAQSGQSA